MKRFFIILMLCVLLLSSCTLQNTPPPAGDSSNAPQESSTKPAELSSSQKDQLANEITRLAAEKEIELPAIYFPQIFAGTPELAELSVEPGGEGDHTVNYLPEYDYENPVVMGDYWLFYFHVTYETNLDELKQEPIYKKYIYNNDEFFVASEYKDGAERLLVNLTYEINDSTICFIGAMIKNQTSMTEELAARLYEDFACIRLR